MTPTTNRRHARAREAVPSRPSAVKTIPCPNCGDYDLRVTDSRPGHVWGEETVRRRRECRACGHRFTTHEVSDDQVARMGADLRSRQKYIAERLIKGILRQMDEGKI